MKLALPCVVSLRTKSEEKLPLDNISLFLLFKIVRSYNLFNMTAYCLFKTQTPKHRTPEHQRANTSKGQNTKKSWYQLHRFETEYHIILLSCHALLIYHIALMHDIILIYLVLISYTLITIINHPGIISHHADIMSCWYIVWYIILIFQLQIQHHTYMSKPWQ